MLAALLGLTGLGILFPEEIAGQLGLGVIPFQIANSMVLLILFGSAFLFIRCPNCALRLVPYAMSKKSIGDWLSWLLSVNQCPKCGFSKKRE